MDRETEERLEAGDQAAEMESLMLHCASVLRAITADGFDAIVCHDAIAIAKEHLDKAGNEGWWVMAYKKIVRLDIRQKEELYTYFPGGRVRNSVRPVYVVDIEVDTDDPTWAFALLDALNSK